MNTAVYKYKYGAECKTIMCYINVSKIHSIIFWFSHDRQQTFKHLSSIDRNTWKAQWEISPRPFAHSFYSYLGYIFIPWGTIAYCQVTCNWPIVIS